MRLRLLRPPALLAERGFAIDWKAVEQGIANVRWPGRLEKISDRPAIYLDGAHNPAAARELRNFWDENLADRQIILDLRRDAR